MIKEIQAKTLLSSTTHPDSLFGIKYTMNLYRGCQHQCIYCDSRSLCYGIENFADILVKVNAIDLLRKELPSKRTKGTVGTGSMNDPYMPVEKQYNMTGRALAVLAEYEYPVHVITKSDLVLRDIALLQDISRTYAAVSVTITTADDALSHRIEPGAPVSSSRFRAIEVLASHGIYAGITMMPILPFIEDDAASIGAIVARARDAGAQYILPWFGMSMRDRQRSYFYAQLDRLYPGLRRRYEQRYGEHYECPVPDASALSVQFSECCERVGLATRMRLFAPVPARRRVADGGAQIRLFD